MKKSMAMTPKSHTPAQHLTTTVAPFRAWRGLRLTLAEGPEGATIESRIIRSLGGECKRQKTLRNAISEQHWDRHQDPLQITIGWLPTVLSSFALVTGDPYELQ